MVMRGAAPSAICPRCGAESPPSDQPLVHCAQCKLSFDPRDEPIARPHRAPSKEYDAAPPGFRIVREPGEWTISWSFERLKGIAVLLLGGLCLAMLLGNLSTPGEDWYQLVLLGLVSAGMAYAGLALTFGETVLRIDARQLTLRREPFRLGRQVWIGRAEIQEIVGLEPRPNFPWFAAKAITPRGAFVLFEAENSNQGAKEAVDCVVVVVREAIAEIPAPSAWSRPPGD